MLTIVSYLLVYILGGLTFIPLILLAILYHVYSSQPVGQLTASSAQDALELTSEEKDVAQEELKGLPSEVKLRVHEPDVAAGYFAVCREYVPGGVSGKPLERQGSQASLATGESPSVYQSMYRSIFERGKTQSPSLDNKTKGSKRANSVFFVVIRLGLLMLYDDEEQLEVRHVISLEKYDIDVYGGGEVIPEGELWVKRNCIRMNRKPEDDGFSTDIKPFYLFSSNCSQKEDFYYAMLKDQGQHTGDAPQPLTFEGEHMVKLIRQLHASEDNLQTRWINALVGRLFLSLYKTSLVEDLVRKKINKKLSRVPKPAFISAIQIRNIHLGDSAPFITGPKLKELTRDGDLTLEADVKYKGNVRIDVAAIARIDLGARFKAREMQILLAVILKSLEGHMYFRVKPPPSNRIWFSFVTMPKLDLSVEPVISSRQITYSLVLKAIESRIREVMADTVVYPNWDDAPFADTLGHEIRSGLWQHDSAEAMDSRLSAAPTLVEGGEEALMQEDEDPEESVEKVILETPAEALPKSAATKHRKNKSSKASSTHTEVAEDVAITTGAESGQNFTPKVMRSGSFAQAAIPVVTKEAALSEALAESPRKSQYDAATGLKGISSRSQPSTPTESPVGSPSTAGIWKRKSVRSPSTTSKVSGSDGDSGVPDEVTQGIAIPRSATINDNTQDSDNASLMTEASNSTQKSNNLAKRQTIASTALAARKWGLGFVTRHSPSNSASNPSPVADNHRDERTPNERLSKESLNLGIGTKDEPFGRGQPLPPPGTPLPGPPKANRMTWAGPLSMLGRKRNGSDNRPYSPASSQVDGSPIPESPQPPRLPPRLREDSRSPSMDEMSIGSSIPRAIKPVLPSRNHESGRHGSDLDRSPESYTPEDDVLIIQAPNIDTDESVASSAPKKEDAMDTLWSSSNHRRDNGEVNSQSDVQGHTSRVYTEPLELHQPDIISKGSGNTVRAAEPSGDIVVDEQATFSTSKAPSLNEAWKHGDVNAQPNGRPLDILHNHTPSPIYTHPARTNTSSTESSEQERSPQLPERSYTPHSLSAITNNTSSTNPSPDSSKPTQTQKARKTRSRQSLIPTPKASRKTSPAEGLAQQSEQVQRRSSSQSLQDLARRRSSGMYHNT
ncbi:hypothetical protein BT63DRAFT_381666 [Microthyrium microscopicum]|uniref:SMP-LTD domain-containing protein n=1 Tax=Microthyrium microscopicum TaxID=703497 RepID=A0A6A6UT31_9PEZI|nr:hypothetical protein BT63DRAFT_381666 [Microthyrium microscopicum]